jgi:hypothetical protein
MICCTCVRLDYPMRVTIINTKQNVRDSIFSIALAPWEAALMQPTECLGLWGVGN